jgi:hypothetical protein
LEEGPKMLGIDDLFWNMLVDGVPLRRLKEGTVAEFCEMRS